MNILTQEIPVALWVLILYFIIAISLIVVLYRVPKMIEEQRKNYFSIIDAYKAIIERIRETNYGFNLKEEDLVLDKKLNNYYTVSKDYKRLYTLSQNQRIVCFVNYGEDFSVRDVAITQGITKEDGSMVIASRGVGYIASSKVGTQTAEEDFIEACKLANLEFIDPQNNKKDNHV